MSIFVPLLFSKRKRNIDLQKIDHQNCCVEMDHAEFKRKICNFQNRRKLLFFLLNTLLIIKDNGDRFCYCHFPFI